MKIYVDDGMQLKVGTGIGKYTQYLVDASKNVYGTHVKVDDYVPRENSQMKKRIEYLLYINSKEFQRKIKDYDVVHFTNYVIPFRKNKNVKYVTTIHDMTAFLFPETLPTAYRIYNQFMIKYALKHADMVFTVSHSVKKEIIQIFPQISAPIEVTYNGVAMNLPKNETITYDSPKLKNLRDESFFLFVGTIEKRKNIAMVIKAFLQLKDSFKIANDIKLVLAGREGFGCDEFHAIVDSSPYKNDVIFTGYISDMDRNTLYSKALAFIFPSVYEGFGVPQVECMLYGLPVISSDIPVNREVSQEYAEYFDLSDLSSLVKAMQFFVDGNCNKIDKENLARCYLKNYDWKKIAMHYVECLKTLVKAE